MTTTKPRLACPAVALLLSACAGAFPGNPQGYAGINHAVITFEEGNPRKILIYGGKEQDRVEIGFRQPNGVEASYSAGGVRAVDGQRVRAEVEAVVAEEAASIAPDIVDRLVGAVCRAAGVTC